MKLIGRRLKIIIGGKKSETAAELRAAGIPEHRQDMRWWSRRLPAWMLLPVVLSVHVILSPIVIFMLGIL